MDTHPIAAIEAGSGKDNSPSREPSHYKLYLLAFSLVLMAGIVWPFDQVLSDRIQIPLSSRGFIIFVLHLAEIVKFFGRGDVLFLLGCILAIYRMKQVAVLACLAMLLTFPIIVPTKIIFERERPDKTNMRSFPSGDTAVVTAFLVPIATLIPATQPIAIAAVATISAERVILGKHFPSDVLAGIAIGVFASAVMLSFKIPVKPRFRRFIRRKWIAAALAVFLPLWPFLGPEGSTKRFLAIFGPAVALLIVAPFIRSWLRTSGRADGHLSKSRERILVLGLVVILFACLLFAATRSTLWEQEEVQFSRTTVEMVRSADYLVPTFNSQPVRDKPIFIYWLMSIPIRIFGQTEIACRFFASVGAVLACLLTYRMGLQLFGPGTGLLAMVILATTPLLFFEGSIATANALLLTTIVATFVMFEAMLRDGLKRLHSVALILVFGAIMLTEGPAGLTIPVLGMIVILVFARKLSLAWIAYLLTSVFIAALIFLAWAIPAHKTFGGESLFQSISRYVLEWFIYPVESYKGSFILFLSFYIPVMILAIFPWMLFLPAALSATAGGRVGGGHGRSFLLGWIIPAFFLMGLVSMRLPHSILPILPAFSLATAGTIKLVERGALSSQDLAWLARGRWLFGVTGFLVSTVLIIGVGLARPLGIGLPGFEPTGKCWGSSIALGSVVIVMTVIALREHSARRYRSTVGVLTAGVVGIIFTVTLIVFPAFELFKFPRRVAKTVHSRVTVDVPVAVLDYNEPNLIFYLRRPTLRSIGNDEGVITWAKEPQSGVIVISRRALKRIKEKSGDLGLQEIAAFVGCDYSKKRWIELVVLGKNLP